MKQVKRPPSGFSIIELAVVIIVISIMAVSILQAQLLTDRASAKALAREMRSVKQMIHIYRDQFHWLPGDDPEAATRFPGGIKSSNAGDGQLENFRSWGEFWTGWNSPYGNNESSVFWQHLRLAGLARGNPAQGFACNAVGGRLGVTTELDDTPTRPVGIGGTFTICSAYIEGNVARMVDAELDDGNAMTGQVFASAETNGLPVTSVYPPLNPYSTGNTFTVCWATS